MFYMGLFYKTGAPNNFVEAIYSSYAEAILKDTGRRFTPVQADAFISIKKYTNFSFSAPTSAGKSYLFQELIKDVLGDVLVVIPSRALLSEYLIKVTNVVGTDTLVLPFIDIINTAKTKNRIFIITPERAEEYFANSHRLNVELILFDEAQLSEEGIRGLKFDSLVRRIEKKSPAIKKVFTHPFIKNPEAQFAKHKITKGVNSEAYMQKSVGKIYIEQQGEVFKYFSPFQDKINGKSYEGNFIQDVIESGGSVLIYVSKASIFNSNYLEFFAKYIDLCDDVTDSAALTCINKIEKYLGTDKDRDKNSNLIHLMRKGIVIHHGSIPLKARLLIEEFVNGKHAKICFSTSTLIQGINMPFDCVWIVNFRFDGNEDQKVLSLKNLIGRAGRTSPAMNSFDYGYVVVESGNKGLFISRLKSEAVLSETSELDKVSIDRNEDFIDVVEAIRDDSFNSELHLTESQLKRITDAQIDDDITYVLDSLFSQKLKLIKAKDYYKFSPSKRNRIKRSFETIYKAHLRRQDLTKGEKMVLSTAIPILLWQIQGKSFAEIVALRYSFLSERDYRRELNRKRKRGEITASRYEEMLRAKKIRFSCAAHVIPDKSFRDGVPLFDRNVSVRDVDFDKIVYDTYDYLDKVLSFSVKDPVNSTLTLFFNRTGDVRAQMLSNYIKYGSTNPKEIWLLRYGFTFDEIELIIGAVVSIDETGIVFNDSIRLIVDENPEIHLLSRYI